MKGEKARQSAGDGSVIKISGQPGRLHLVWHDRKTSKKRICRPSMLEATHSAEEKGWEIVGEGAGSAEAFKMIAADLNLVPCKHCINWSKR